MKQLLLYIKTTEKCQLDCAHCFTNGRNGADIFFDSKRTIQWLKNMREYIGEVEHPSIRFHGGEPFLVKVSEMRTVWEECKHLWKNLKWTATTNLVYKLSNEHKSLITECFDGRLSTSWDRSIRFKNEVERGLWEYNVNCLTENPKNNLDLIISIDKSLLQCEPIEIIQMAFELGFKSIHLERISLTGNALLNSHIIPTNKELDAWLLKWFEQSIQYEVWNWAPPCSMMKSILSSYFYQTHHGCRCRTVETKTFTVNASGTIGGCPNKAVSKVYGTIQQPIDQLMNNELRLESIVCEQNRNPICYNCPVFDICNGDCNCLDWQGDVCAAPKSVMEKIKNERQDDVYHKLLGQFIGVE